MTREEFTKEVNNVYEELGFCNDELPNEFEVVVKQNFDLKDVPNEYIVDGNCPFCSMFDPENKRVLFWIDKIVEQAKTDALMVPNVDFLTEFAFMIRHELRHLWQWVNCHEGYMVDKDRIYLNKIAEKDAYAFSYKLHVPTNADEVNKMMKEGWYEIDGRRV